MADGVPDARGLLGEVDEVRNVSGEVEEVQRQPADEEHDGYGAQQDVGAVEVAATQLAPVVLGWFLFADEARGVATAELVGDPYVGGLVDNKHSL